MIFKTCIYPITILLFLSGCETPEEKFDRETGQQPVLSREKIDEIIDSYETISYHELDDYYKNYSDPEVKFRQKLEDTEYRIIQGTEVYRYVVGKTRIRSFLCTDEYYIANEENPEANKTQYWLVDKKLLYMILDFMEALEEKNFNPYGFYVRESHRHPRYNWARGGASQSQHIYGKAADLVIEDINFDGETDQQDKEICLEILDELVGDKGGMGLYTGTMVIHIDTRGHRARWNEYKRPH
ncbi:MAG: hypothetical protein HYZ14_16290 [Bacteroidetes bacterium]|nr:hypothetical protein [Bacteroidota bacterium]